MSAAGLVAAELVPAEVLPHDVPTATHHPDECKAQALAQGGELWQCCPDHWLPADVARAQAANRARAWAAVVATGRWHP